MMKFLFLFLFVITLSSLMAEEVPFKDDFKKSFKDKYLTMENDTTIYRCDIYSLSDCVFIDKSKNIEMPHKYTEFPPEIANLFFAINAVIKANTYSQSYHQLYKLN